MAHEAKHHAPPTLLEYEEPVLVNGAAASSASAGPSSATTTALVGVDPRGVRSDQAEAVRVLNTILPPREWTESDGKLWSTRASSRPPSRDDVIRLRARLYASLKHRQARAVPLCPIREELFSSGVFDELIRQVVLDGCPERGLLLMRVRDEARLSLAAYKTLYTSSSVYSQAKVQAADEHTESLLSQINHLSSVTAALKAKVFELQALQECMREDEDTARRRAKKRHQEVIDALTAQNAQLSKFLADISARAAAEV